MQGLQEFHKEKLNCFRKHHVRLRDGTTSGVVLLKLRLDPSLPVSLQEMKVYRLNFSCQCRQKMKLKDWPYSLVFVLLLGHRRITHTFISCLYSSCKTTLKICCAIDKQRSIIPSKAVFKIQRDGY